jgi:hypothetical protein
MPAWGWSRVWGQLQLMQLALVIDRDLEYSQKGIQIFHGKLLDDLLFELTLDLGYLFFKQFLTHTKRFSHLLIDVRTRLHNTARKGFFDVITLLAHLVNACGNEIRVLLRVSFCDERSDRKCSGLVTVYHVLKDEKDYQEFGGNYFDECDRQWTFGAHYSEVPHPC